jgi:20S proteasome subunit beta 4
MRCSFRSTDIFDLFREVLLGITGKDFTLIATSKAAMRGATILKASDDKTRQLNKHTLMAFSGEAGDTSM